MEDQNTCCGECTNECDNATDASIEAEIQAKGLTAPRLTPDDIAAAIVGEDYSVFGGRLTVCVLELRNGYLVTGESSCVSADNFDAEIGRKLARQKAVDKVWELEGYALRERLASDEAAGAVDEQYKAVIAELAQRLQTADMIITALVQSAGGSVTLNRESAELAAGHYVESGPADENGAFTFRAIPVQQPTQQ